MFWKLAIVIWVLWMIIRRWKRRKMIPLYNQFKPKICSLPLVGHSYLLIGSSEDRMKLMKKIGEESYEKGGLLSAWHGNKLYFVVSDPIAAEAILKTCLEKDDVLKVTQVLLGNGSIFAPVSIWRPRRKVLAPTFSAKTLNQFVSIFAEQSGVMAQQLRNKVNSGTFSIWNYFTTYSMDSVCETTLGFKTKAQLQSDVPFLDAFSQVCQLFTSRAAKPWLHNDTLYQLLPEFKKLSSSKKIVLDFVNQIIQTKKQSVDLDSNINAPAAEREDGLKTFLELLIEVSRGGGGYGNLELQEETLVLILAGTDTSAVGASFTALMLALHPAVQDKCYKELQEVFGESDRPVTTKDLPRLKYLDAVIRESLRMYPPGPFILRKVDKDIVLPSGVTLVEGCGVLISIFAVHRNPEYWGEDADQFRPERFLDSSLKHPAAFMPFSCGPRSCLGYQYAMMSMKTALATLLRHYRVLPPEGGGGPLRLSIELMMRHVDNYEIQLERRN